jgi:hypothetical protein
MVKYETVIKLALQHGLIKEPYEKKLNVDINKLIPEARAEVLRIVTDAKEDFKRTLEDRLKTMGVLPLYHVVWFNGRRVRVYRENKNKEMQQK